MFNYMISKNLIFFCIFYFSTIGYPAYVPTEKSTGDITIDVETSAEIFMRKARNIIGEQFNALEDAEKETLRKFMMRITSKSSVLNEFLERIVPDKRERNDIKNKLVTAKQESYDEYRKLRIKALNKVFCGIPSLPRESQTFPLLEEVKKEERSIFINHDVPNPDRFISHFINRHVVFNFIGNAKKTIIKHSYFALEGDIDLSMEAQRLLALNLLKAYFDEIDVERTISVSETSFCFKGAPRIDSYIVRNGCLEMVNFTCYNINGEASEEPVITCEFEVDGSKVRIDKIYIR